MFLPVFPIETYQLNFASNIEVKTGAKQRAKTGVKHNLTGNLNC